MLAAPGPSVRPICLQSNDRGSVPKDEQGGSGVFDLLHSHDSVGEFSWEHIVQKPCNLFGRGFSEHVYLVSAALHTMEIVKR